MYTYIYSVIVRSEDHYRVLQYTAKKHCNSLQYPKKSSLSGLKLTTTDCNTLRKNATHCIALQHPAAHCNTLQHPATYILQQCRRKRRRYQGWSTLPHTAIHWKHCSTLQHTAAPCNTPQHPAAPYNILQHPATPCNTLQQISYSDADEKSVVIRAEAHTRYLPKHIDFLTWDMTHSYVGHDPFMCGTWLIQVCGVIHSYNLPEHIDFRWSWLIHTWDMTHLFVGHDSFLYGTRLLHMWIITHSWAWLNLHLQSGATWLIHVCDVTHPRLGHDSFMCGTYSIHMRDMRRFMWIHINLFLILIFLSNIHVWTCAS